MADAGEVVGRKVQAAIRGFEPSFRAIAAVADSSMVPSVPTTTGATTTSPDTGLSMVTSSAE